MLPLLGAMPPPRGQTGARCEGWSVDIRPHAISSKGLKGVDSISASTRKAGNCNTPAGSRPLAPPKQLPVIRTIPTWATRSQGYAAYLSSLRFEISNPRFSLGGGMGQLVGPWEYH